jgi:hypothetical protein
MPTIVAGAKRRMVERAGRDVKRQFIEKCACVTKKVIPAKAGI